MAPSGLAIDQKVMTAVTADVTERDRRKCLALARRHNPLSLPIKVQLRAEQRGHDQGGYTESDGDKCEDQYQAINHDALPFIFSGNSGADGEQHAKT
jgi:hypothetical protein